MFYATIVHKIKMKKMKLELIQQKCELEMLIKPS